MPACSLSTTDVNVHLPDLEHNDFAAEDVETVHKIVLKNVEDFAERAHNFGWWPLQLTTFKIDVKATVSDDFRR